MDEKTIRKSFVFYESWFEAIKNLPRDIQGDVLTSIIEYGLYGETTGNLKPITKAFLAMVKPQIDANNKKFENGKKGGRPSKPKTKEKPNNNQAITKEEPNVYVYDNINIINPPIIPQSEIRTEGNIQTENKHRLNVDFVKDEFKNVFLSWIEYKHERKESYKSERSLKACYNRLLKLSNNNPEVANSIIEQSIANNWAGFFELNNHKNETAGRKEPCGQSSKRYRKLD